MYQKNPITWARKAALEENLGYKRTALREKPLYQVPMGIRSIGHSRDVIDFDMNLIDFGGKEINPIQFRKKNFDFFYWCNSNVEKCGVSSLSVYVLQKTI